MSWETTTTWTVSTRPLIEDRSDFSDDRVWDISTPDEPKSPCEDCDWEPYAGGVIVSGEGRDQRCIRWTAWRWKR